MSLKIFFIFYISDWVNQAIIWGMELEPNNLSNKPVQQWFIKLINSETNISIIQKPFRENLGHGIILDMVAIPGGKFIMGSPENENGRC